jgi:hypothetical protein
MSHPLVDYEEHAAVRDWDLDEGNRQPGQPSGLTTLRRRPTYGHSRWQPS